MRHDPLFQAGFQAANAFILGPTLEERTRALAALAAPAGLATMATTVLQMGDGTPCAIMLEGVATYHANLGDGARSAGVAEAIVGFHAPMTEGPPSPEREIARKGTASAATSGAYGAARSGYHAAVVDLADRYAGALDRWGLLDAARTLETQAAEALLKDQRIDDARSRLPSDPPGDMAGGVLWRTVSAKLVDPGPGGTYPSTTQRETDILAELERLVEMLDSFPHSVPLAEELRRAVQHERSLPPPKDDADRLERAHAMMQLLRKAMERLSALSPSAF